MRQEMPAGILHIGKPPDNVQLYSPSQRWLSARHVDPNGFHLRRLVATLDVAGAFDEDLVIMDFTSFYQNRENRQRSVEENHFFSIQIRGLDRMYMYYRIRSIMLTSVPEGWNSHSGISSGYFDAGWPFYEFSLAMYCQVIVTTKIRLTSESDQMLLQESQNLVNKHMTPEWLTNFEKTFSKLVNFTKSDMQRALNQRCRRGSSMPLATHDALGFQTVCEKAQFRWLFVSFVFELALRGGPAPRYQDVPPGKFVDGIVPKGCRPWVLSYSWSAHLHPFPGGGKMVELANTLRQHGAKPTDVVFVDFMSLVQAGSDLYDEEKSLPVAYASKNPHAKISERSSDGSRITLPDRTKDHVRQFEYALFETTRLYAFNGGYLPNGDEVLGCKVLVLPNLEDPQTFPDHGEIVYKENRNCDPWRPELHTSWGFIKSIPYEQGGWTCAEYAVARKCGTIANGSDENVVKIEMARAWPSTVEEYAVMMDGKASSQVTFTKKGDRDAVRFNFFKYTHKMCSSRGD